MPMKTPMNAARLRHHLNYSWWKYVLLIIVAGLGWSLIFSVTQYRAPEEKKVVVYIYGIGEDAAFNAYLEQVRLDQMSDMEDMHATFSMPDDQYGPMVLMAHISAGEGDLYIFPRDQYQTYINTGLFEPLEDLPELALLDPAQQPAIERAWRKDEGGNRHLFGIPLSALPGLRELVVGDDYYLSIATNNQNEENTYKLFRILVNDFCTPPATATDLPLPTVEEPAE